MVQMIPKKLEPVENLWQKELASAFTDPRKLLEFLEFKPEIISGTFAARKLFPMRVPVSFAQRMQKGDIHDPLLNQVLPLNAEFVDAEGFVADPLQEQGNGLKGLIHKYQSRVLLVVRGGCAVNCRYCFRRHFPYQDNQVNREGWASVIEYIQQDQAIEEVIYSGGDPLMAKDDFLAWLTQSLAAIPHVKYLRIHTRLPVVIPSRVTRSLLDWFTDARLQPIMVVHVNHSNEVDEHFAQAMRLLREAGVTLLNQGVVLKGINDSVDAQVKLSKALFDVGVLPYYLHMLDKVKGASHFLVDDEEAIAIQREVVKRLPGYLVPKLVREIGGQPGKTPLDLQLHP
ncbi:EF-P beta-lysylation protein EpmB [Alteromonas sp. a30]|uniref:EF-P beta-lysylation protein EpmB n=1 Tax=Alteromonas sp. a30 TaxID=2730917 RepID=UPI00227E49D0|nr:EF-P beta-lysylation protein EpmB [Alteromonas sp. a30]MCY7294668.1 EF-P beta-lysylation protein EpmB [Alteromonas sp. a30]